MIAALVGVLFALSTQGMQGEDHQGNWSVGPVPVSDRSYSSFGVEDWLQIEELRFTKFAANGDLVVGMAGPRAEAVRSPWSPDSVSDDLYRARLIINQAEAGSGHHLLIPGAIPVSLSPDGLHVAYLREGSEELAVGVCDVANGRRREFDLPPATYGPRPTWVSDSQVVYVWAPSRLAPQRFSAELSGSAARMSEGLIPTASTVGSGRYASGVVSGIGGLAIGNAATGTSRQLGQGRFEEAVPSPDGRWIATTRIAPLTFDVSAPLVAWRSKRRELVVYDLREPGREIEVCKDDCDLLPRSLSWSPKSDRLLFATLPGDGVSENITLRVFNAGDYHVSAIDPAAWQLAFEGWRGLDPRYGWLGEEVIVRTGRSAGSNAGADVGQVLTAGGRVVISARWLSSRGAKLIGVRGEHVLVALDGDIWALSRDGSTSRNLTAEIAADVSLWEGQLGRPTLAFTNLPSSIYMVTKDEGSGQELLQLDIDSGRLGPGIPIPVGAKVLDVQVAAGRMAVLRTQGAVESMDVVNVGGDIQRTYDINLHLRDVLRGRATPVTYDDVDGKELTSWMILPPGYEGERKLPMVVLPYPGISYGSRSSFPLESEALNPHILAGYGYVVLMPSLPMEQTIPRDPLYRLSDRVLRAVDAAVATGYVDGDRVALHGTSFGAFATVGMLGQSARFKTGVAIAGPYNLTSTYGVPRIGSRLRAEYESQDMSVEVAWAESGQAGFGAAPWRDPQRYIRNSPLMLVESISAPLLIFHGDLDSTVPFTQSEELFTALFRTNKDAVFVRYWGEGHGLPMSPANTRDFWRRIFAWYDEHLGPPFDVAAALGYHDGQGIEEDKGDVDN